MRGVRETLTHLRDGGLVALMADRDIQRGGRLTPFFGERAPLPTGPIELALRPNAAVVPGFPIRTRGGRGHPVRPAPNARASRSRTAPPPPGGPRVKHRKKPRPP